MKTTLSKIRACSPCSSGWTKLLSNLGKIKDDDAARAYMPTAWAAARLIQADLLRIVCAEIEQREEL